MNSKYFWTPNERLEEKVDQFFQYIEDINMREFDGKISILLLGSFSRGEASWKVIDGIDTLVSDIEFMTIVPPSFSQFARLEKIFIDAKEIMFPDQKSSLFHIDPGIGKGTTLSSLERKLITYDANVFARTVVGPDLKSTLPNVTYDNINMNDIWEVMIHRIFSILYWGRPLKKDGKLEEYRYNLAKNSLDLMTVLLVNHHQLVSGFANRLNAINKLNIDNLYKSYFEYCLSVKLSTECSHIFTIREMEELFIKILIDQRDSFSFHLNNFACNIPFIFRRYLGMIKRMFISKHIPCTQKSLLQKMIKLYMEDKDITEEILNDNFVLNGYPEHGDK